MPASLARAKATFSVLVAAVEARRILVGWADAAAANNSETSSVNVVMVSRGANIDSPIERD